MTQTETKKTDRKMIIAAAVVICAAAAAGCIVYQQFFAFKKYDLRDYTTEITFDGYDGEAAAYSPEPSYGALEYIPFEDAADLSDVLDTVSYTVTPGEGLSNGDIVKIEAAYDEELAKARRIRLTNLTWTEEVSGAFVRITPDNVTEEIYSEVVSRGVEEANNYYESRSGNSSVDTKFVTAFLVNPREKNDYNEYTDVLMLLCRTSYNHTNWNNSIVKNKEYSVVMVYNIGAESVPGDWTYEVVVLAGAEEAREEGIESDQDLIDSFNEELAPQILEIADLTEITEERFRK